MGQPLKWTTKEKTSSTGLDLLDRCGGKPSQANSDKVLIFAQEVGRLQQSLPFEFQNQCGNRVLRVFNRARMSRNAPIATA